MILRLTLASLLLLPIPSDESDRLSEGLSRAGWTRVNGRGGNWHAVGGEIRCLGDGKDWLATNCEFADFTVSLEYQLEPGGNSGVLFRAPCQGDPSFDGLEIQLLDDDAPAHRALHPWQYTGSVYGVIAARRGATRKAGEWNHMTLVVEGSKVAVELNGQLVLHDDLARYPDLRDKHPGLGRLRGLIGLQSHDDPVRFRNIRIRGSAGGREAGGPSGLAGSDRASR